MATERKRPPTDQQIEVAKRLSAIWDAKQAELGLTQEIAGTALDISQSAVSHYLKGFNAIGFEKMFIFAQLLRVHPYEIDPSFRERLPGDLRLAVDVMPVATSPESAAAYRAIAGAAIQIHEGRPAYGPPPGDDQAAKS